METVGDGRAALLWAMPDRERAGDHPEDLSFQSFTCHGTLISPRFNTEIVFSVFSSTSGRERAWFVSEWTATIPTRKPDSGANLERIIPSELHRGVAQTGEPDGGVRPAGGCLEKKAMRLGCRIFAVLALIAGVGCLVAHGTGSVRPSDLSGAAARQQSSVGPNGTTLQAASREMAEVSSNLQPGPTASVAEIVKQDAINRQRADQAAINNNMLGALDISLAAMKRPAVAAGESGGKGDN